MAKQYELLLTRRDPEDAFKFKSVDKIEGNTLVEILTQFNFVIVRECERIKQDAIWKERKKGWEDDIPF